MEAFETMAKLDHKLMDEKMKSIELDKMDEENKQTID
jgi:hypothetical protein